MGTGIGTLMPTMPNAASHATTVDTDEMISVRRMECRGDHAIVPAMMTKEMKAKLEGPENEPKPDPRQRVERFVWKVAKSGPQYRAPKSKERPASKGRVRKGRSRA